MAFNFTLDQIRRCIPRNRNPGLWYFVIAEHLPKYQINTVNRVAGFISQCQHESSDFNILQENLNYSAQGLRQIFARHFPTEQLALQYQRKPEQIANRVYGNRMGNGDEQSGDGWRFRGRGVIQITGRDNYTRCSQYLFNSNLLVEDPDLLLDPNYAILSACWFWEVNGLNRFCDARDVVGLTRRINGGTNGLDDRRSKWEQALRILA